MGFLGLFYIYKSKSMYEEANVWCLKCCCMSLAISIYNLGAAGCLSIWF